MWPVWTAMTALMKLAMPDAASAWPDVGLDRAEGAEAPVLREMAKGLAQGGEFDGVAEGRPGAVAFDKADITRGKSREGDRLADDGGLAEFAGRGIAHPPGTVIVDYGGQHHGIDVVAVAQGICQPFQDDDARPAGKDRARGIFVKGAAVAVAREDHAFLEQVTFLLGHIDGHPSGQGHVARAAAQVLAGHVHGGKRAGAGRLHAQAGPFRFSL